MLRTLNEQQISIGDFGVSAASLAELLKAIESGDVDRTRAKDVFAEMVATGKTAADAMAELGIAKVDASETVELCRELLNANPKIVADLKDGKTKAVGALIGQAKKRNPNVNPGQIKEVCLQLASEM